MKNGLLENEMVVESQSMKVEMKINKVVANNSWIKENINYLKENNFFNAQIYLEKNGIIIL